MRVPSTKVHKTKLKRKRMKRKKMRRKRGKAILTKVGKIITSIKTVQYM